MSLLIWLRILRVILLLIAQGMSKSRAIECAATAFGVSGSLIRRKMG